MGKMIDNIIFCTVQYFQFLIRLSQLFMYPGVFNGQRYCTGYHAQKINICGIKSAMEFIHNRHHANGFIFKFNGNWENVFCYKIGFIIHPAQKKRTFGNIGDHYGFPGLKNTSGNSLVSRKSDLFKFFFWFLISVLGW